MKGIAWALAACLLSCGSPPAPAAGSGRRSPGPAFSAASANPASAGENADPPPPGVTLDAPFPAIARRQLDSGFPLFIVERRALPLLELELLIRGGHSSDGSAPGAALVTGELLKYGGAGRWSGRHVLERVEALGARLDVVTDRDATRISLAVVSSDFEPALEILAALVQSPRFDAGEFTKLRQRRIERVAELSRTDASWMSSMVLYRELYELPAALHPYARYDATLAELKAITLDDCRAWYRAQVTPKNAFLVAAGDVVPDTLTAAAARAFSGWKGEAPAPVSFASPHLPSRRRVFVVDHAGSSQSFIRLATLGPELRAPTWPALAVMNQILGASGGRLFMELRERRRLAHWTGSGPEEVPRGPVPIVIGAVTQAPQTGRGVAALIEQTSALASSPPSEEEVAGAVRSLADGFPIESAGVGALGGLTARLGLLGLPDDWYDDYRSELRATTPAHVQRLGARYMKTDRMLIVVAGPADVIAEPLRRFGPVSVVEPEQGFLTRRSLTHDPTVSLDPVAPRP